MENKIKMKITKMEEVKDEVKEEIKYFGKTRKELLKKYHYIFGMVKFFDKDVLDVRLNNNRSYVDKDLNVLLEFETIENFENYYIIELNGDKYKVSE